MKIIAVGDTHGRTFWELVRLIEGDFDKFVFIGDYFDSFDVKADDQVSNFKKILAFKDEYPDKVVLLYGNHEHHYMSEYEDYSGKQHGRTLYYRSLIGDAIAAGQIQMCYKHYKFLFTHAGISKTWANTWEVDLENVESSVNEVFKTKPYAFNFSESDRTGYGGSITQSPIWIRPEQLRMDGLDDVIQIVGHTHQVAIEVDKRPVFIDTMERGKYLVIEDNVLIAKKCTN